MLSNEPAIVGGLVSILVALAAHFGLKLDATATTTLTSVVAGVVAIIVRHFVTPTAKA